MGSTNFEDILEVFNKIDISDNPGREKNKQFVRIPYTSYKYIPKQKFPSLEPEPIDLKKYIQENCNNKIQVLNRETFPKIKRPIAIFFHHFREKCNYLTKWLDIIDQLTLKFGDRIEFIAADIIDMDMIYPGTNPIKYLCRMVRPKDESPQIYVIDEKKLIHQYLDAYNTVENLTELCENFLNGKLYPSQPLPVNNETKLVKICVHDNYEELVLKSTKNMFLIINLEQHQQSEYEPNYDKVALTLKDYNLDILYMVAEKNYIPFEYNAKSYPTILFIPSTDKDNFIYYKDRRKEDNIIEFLKKCLEQPEYLLSLQQLRKNEI